MPPRTRRSVPSGRPAAAGPSARRAAPTGRRAVPSERRRPTAGGRSTRIPSPSYRVERTTLGNGLRVVFAPDTSAAVVGVSVHYDVGFRSEPEGRTGFAHLFEHLMFQGSENVAKMEHAGLVQGAGGVFNGSTTPDYTNYFQALPSGALELALFLEADRMRAPRITQENLENQIAVVQEEIRVNVLNRPYGGFPWIHLPPVVFDTFPNAHDGYGAFEELQAATLTDAADFFARYYAPGNAVLTVAGDFDVDTALTLVERHFGDVPAREVPLRPSFAEPPPDRERRAVRHDPLAPQPALAVGWQMPDPVAEPELFAASVVLAALLSDGDASRLQRRLVQRDRSVTGVSAYPGTFGEPFAQRGPMLMQVLAHHPGETSADQVLAAVDEEIDRVAQEGPAPAELARVQAAMAADILHEVDHVLDRTLTLAVGELIRGRAELINELPARLASVSAVQVAEAAGRLGRDNRGVLEVVPGAGA